MLTIYTLVGVNSECLSTNHSIELPDYLTFFIQLVPLCKSFLSRKWYAFNGREVQGGESNSLLEQLLKGYLKDAKFSFIRSTLHWMETEMPDLNAKGGVLTTMPCIKM